MLGNNTIANIVLETRAVLLRPLKSLWGAETQILHYFYFSVTKHDIVLHDLSHLWCWIQ